MNRQTSWLRRGVALAAAFLVSSAGWGAAALPGYSGGRLQVVGELGEDSSYVHYHLNGAEKTAADMTWSDQGHTGQAISLNGAGETLELEYNQLQMHTMTFAGWYYWQGSADGTEDGLYSQRLFTLSHSDDLWLTVMPRARDGALADGDGRTVDGVYMEFYQGTGGEVTSLKSWNPVELGEANFGLPLNEWHHVALTMDGQAIRLYIDGRLWFEETLILGVEEMRNNMLTIGGGRWEGEPTFYGRIDDMAVYDFAMSAEEIAMLYAGVDPRAEGATLPSTAAPSLPTGEGTTGSAAPSGGQDGGGRLFGLPIWAVLLAAALLAAFVGLSIFLSVYRPSAPPGKPAGGEPGPGRKPDGNGKGGAEK
ncbi:MAG TPA: LamG domain-containing protein [Firmicutes bacterium]|nr:LamG domain-containing protein [Bacillota bacterium]